MFHLALSSHAVVIYQSYGSRKSNYHAPISSHVVLSCYGIRLLVVMRNSSLQGALCSRFLYNADQMLLSRAVAYSQEGVHCNVELFCFKGNCTST